MKDRGYVTIFVTLLISVLLLVVTVVLYVSKQSCAETKASTSLCSANSSELARFNRMIFDRYHILLFDKNHGGQGEGAVEQDIEEALEYDLGNDFSIDSVELSGTVGIVDYNCYEFKRQINENFLYDAIDYTVDKIMEKTEECDAPITEDTEQAINSDIAEEQQEIQEELEAEEENDSSETTEALEETDPRETLKTYTDAGLAILLFPADAELSGNAADLTTLPSYGNTSSIFRNVNTSFDNFDQMMLDSTLADGWSTSLVTEAEGIMYASKYFNCLTEKKYDDTFFNLELEYLIGGDDTDGANFRHVVDRLLLLRFAMNFAYVVTDPDKLLVCEGVAAGLCVLMPMLQPVVKYLIAGCWAYIESIVDVYMLVNGNKVMFFKTDTTWRSSFESLADLETFAEDSDGEQGLDYKEYLMILLALEGDSIYYRMLDLMQLNVNNPGTDFYDPTFRMENAITAFGVNAEVSYEGTKFSLHEEAGY